MGADNVAAAAVVEKMGGVQRAVGKLPEAEALLRRAVAMREAAQGDGHLSLRPPLHQLVEVLAEAKNPDAAVLVGRRCLAIAETNLGPKHVEVAEELARLGGLLRQTDHLAEADSVLSRCLHIREMVRVCPSICVVLGSLATDASPSAASLSGGVRWIRAWRVVGSTPFLAQPAKTQSLRAVGLSRRTACTLVTPLACACGGWPRRGASLACGVGQEEGDTDDRSRA